MTCHTSLSGAMRSSVLPRLQGVKSHSPCRAASTTTPLHRRSIYADYSTVSVSKSRTFLLSKQRTSTHHLHEVNSPSKQRPYKTSHAAASSSTGTRLHASKKDSGSPDREELLKAGLELAKTVASADPRIQAVSAFAGKYLGTDGPGASSSRSGAFPTAFSAPDRTSPYRRISLLILLLINVATFVLANHFAPQSFSSLPLNHVRPNFWQFLTSCFCTASWQQLSAVVFMAVAFGAQVAVRHGAAGVWLAYTLGAAGTNLMWYWLLPEKVGRAALLTSSSLYGSFALFLVSSLLQVGGFWWWLFEFLLLGQFLVWLLLKDATLAALPAVTVWNIKVSGAVVGLGGCFMGVGACFALWYCFTRFVKWAKK